jgi:hypothetical protein
MQGAVRERLGRRADLRALQDDGRLAQRLAAEVPSHGQPALIRPVVTGGADADKTNTIKGLIRNK